MNEKKELLKEIKKYKLDIRFLEKELSKTNKKLIPLEMDVARALNAWHCRKVSTQEHLEIAQEKAMMVAKDRYAINVKIKETKAMLKEALGMLKELE